MVPDLLRRGDADEVGGLIVGWLGGRRISAVATMTAGLLMAAAPAQAWYVDISITGAGRVYETTDANELDEHCPDSVEGFASPGNTPTGTLGANCRAGDASGDYGHGWVVRYVAEAAPGYRFDGWQSDGRTSPGPVLCDGSGGSSSYAGAACQFATFANLQVRARFVDDTAPAMTSLTGPSAPVNGAAAFTFSAAADPTLQGFECRVMNVHDWVACSSGRQENPAASGTYTFEVRAVDHSGNRSATSSWQWIVDKFAPETTLDSASGPSGVVNSTSATLSFSGSGDTVGFRCTLDGVSSSCSSPKTYAGLAQGAHTFAVQAIDAAGNVDSSPATRTWSVDTVPSETTVDDGPAHDSTVSSKTATFTFSSSSPDVAAYSCRLDAGAIDTDCSSPVTYDGLAEGPHTFRVWSRDHAGNTDPTPASVTWTVDLPDAPVEPPVEPPAPSSPPVLPAPAPVLPAPAPVVTPATMDVQVKFRHRVRDGRTKIRTLKLTHVPQGATVRVTCKDKRRGCAFKAKKLQPGDSSVVLTKLFRNKSLAAGAVVAVQVTAPGYDSMAFRYKTRSGSKAPSGGMASSRSSAPTPHFTLSSPWAPLSASIITWFTNG